MGGGAVRDICVGETPGIFQQSNFYAVAGLGGSFAFVALAYAGSPLPLAGVACVFVVVFLRYWSVYFDWKTSNEADLTPHVARGVGKVRRVVSGVFLHGGDATVAQKERRRRGRFLSAILSELTMCRAMPCQDRRGRIRRIVEHG